MQFVPPSGLDDGGYHMGLFVETHGTAETGRPAGKLGIVRQLSVVLVPLAAELAVAAGHRASAAQSSVAAGEVAPAPDDSVTATRMRNVHFRVGEGVSLRIRHLDGTMSGEGGVVDFDRPASFVTRIDTAEIGLTGDDLSNLLNHHVFHYGGAPLKHLKAEVRANGIRMTGTLRKGVEIPFDILSEASVMPDGRLRLHPVKTKILGVNGEALMKALGLNRAKLIDLSKAKGVTVKGNDLFIEPTKVLPPPAIEGKVVAIRIENGQMVQVFARQEGGMSPGRRALIPPDSAASKYMYFRGGKLHFGQKMVMADADMFVV